MAEMGQRGAAGAGGAPDAKTVAAASSAAAPILPMTSVSSSEPSASLLWPPVATYVILSVRELYRRGKNEFWEELPLFKTRWKLIVALAAWQYFHGALSQLAHRLHTRPQTEPLSDAGFRLLPELGPTAREVASEAVFASMFSAFVAWSFSPFFRDGGSGRGGGEGQSGDGDGATTIKAAVAPSPSTSPRPPPVLPLFVRKRLPELRPPKFYTCVLYGRVLVTLAACQLLRVLSFLSTSLPGPNYHCRAGSPVATLPMPSRWWGHLVVDVGEQATKGCGDLIFSSHTTFALVGCLAYTTHGNFRKVKVLLWSLAVLLSVLIVASRKHYTVDVVVAWYVVPLVWHFARGRWTLAERGSGGSGGGGARGGDVDGDGGRKKRGPFPFGGKQQDLQLPVIRATASSSPGGDSAFEGSVGRCRGCCPSCGAATATAGGGAANGGGSGDNGDVSTSSSHVVSRRVPSHPELTSVVVDGGSGGAPQQKSS